MFDVVKTAYEWHSGQWSALYSFASTGGKIQNRVHRFDLLCEIDDCMKIAEGNDNSDEYDALLELRAHIDNCPSECDLCDDEDD